MRTRRWRFILWLPDITFDWCWTWLPRFTRWPDSEYWDSLGAPAVKRPVIFSSLQWGPFEIRRYR